MGYFANGTEGDCYRAKWCDRCANDGDEKNEIGCGVMDVHMFYGYSGTKEQKELLDILIPRQGSGNGECSMFRAK